MNQFNTVATPDTGTHLGVKAMTTFGQAGLMTNPGAGIPHSHSLSGSPKEPPAAGFSAANATSTDHTHRWGDTTMNKQSPIDTTARHGRSTKDEMPATSRQSPGIGHNSATAVAEPEGAGEKDGVMDLQILREILLGPLSEETSTRFTDLAQQLKQREAEIAQREEDLRKQIETVKQDLKQREDALNKKVAMVEADLARRETALMASVAKVEEELTQREEELAAGLARLETDIESCKSQSSQINTDLSDKLAKACRQQSMTIRGIGYAITQLGNHVSELGKTGQPDG